MKIFDKHYTSSPERPVNLVGSAFLIGAAVGVVLVLILVAIASDPPEPAAVTGGPSLTSGEEDPRDEGAATVSRPASSSRMERCATAAQALGAQLAAARPALDQWEVHVGAMNKLVVGAITLQQATKFWNQTRLGAQRRVEHFRDSLASLRQQGVDCPAPGMLAPGRPALRPCARQVGLDLQVLRAAETSIATWEHHVHHMEMLRSGELSPERATEMWLSMWRRGVRELDTYHRAARLGRQGAGCPAGSAG